MQYKRRHYRVAKKQVEKAPEKGTFVSKKQAKNLSLTAVLLGIIIFVEGILLGFMLCKALDDSKE